MRERRGEEGAPPPTKEKEGKVRPATERTDGGRRAHPDDPVEAGADCTSAHSPNGRHSERTKITCGVVVDMSSDEDSRNGGGVEAAEQHQGGRDGDSSSQDSSDEDANGASNGVAAANTANGAAKRAGAAAGGKGGFGVDGEPAYKPTKVGRSLEGMLLPSHPQNPNQELFYRCLMFIDYRLANTFVNIKPVYLGSVVCRLCTVHFLKSLGGDQMSVYPLHLLLSCSANSKDKKWLFSLPLGRRQERAFSLSFRPRDRF